MQIPLVPLPKCFAPPILCGAVATRPQPLTRHLKSGAFDFLQNFSREVRGLGVHHNGNGSRVRWRVLMEHGCPMSFAFDGDSVASVVVLGGITASFSAPRGTGGDVIIGAFLYAHEGWPTAFGAIAKTRYTAPQQGKKGRPSKKSVPRKKRNQQLWMTYAGPSGELYRFESGIDVRFFEEGYHPTSQVRDAQWLSAGIWAARQFPYFRMITDELGWFAGRNKPGWGDLGELASYVVPMDVSFDPWEPWMPRRGEII